MNTNRTTSRTPLITPPDALPGGFWFAPVTVARWHYVLWQACFGVCFGVSMLLCAVVLGGCSTHTTAHRAAEAYHAAIGEEYLAYVESDGGLTETQKERRRGTVHAMTQWVSGMNGRRSQPLKRKKGKSADTPKAPIPITPPEAATLAIVSTETAYRDLLEKLVGLEFQAARRAVDDIARIAECIILRTTIVRLNPAAAFDPDILGYYNELRHPTSTLMSLGALSADQCAERFNAILWGIGYGIMKMLTNYNLSRFNVNSEQPSV